MKNYEALKQSITPEMINNAAGVLGEDKEKVSSAANIILAALLGKFMYRGETPKMDELIKEAAEANLFEKRHTIFAGHGVEDGKNLGERVENNLIGAANKEFPAAVAAESGISTTNADRLTNYVAAMIAGYVGLKATRDNLSIPAMLGELQDDREKIVNDIPDRVANSIGIDNCVNNLKSRHIMEEQKKKNNWLMWLIIAIIIILIIILSMRSCKSNNMEQVIVTEEIMSDTQNPTEGATFVTHTLPNGEVITVAQGGCEDCMMKYLLSGNYSKATDKELADSWIQFDKIDFKHNSLNELEANSMAQIINIAKILKNYPDVKIKIGGMADKTGTKAVNMDISKERANYIKSLLVKDGIKADRISTEGFGEEFASVPANASDAKRAIDRSIAMRFVK